MNIASIFVTAQYLWPRYFSDAPKWYRSLPSTIKKRSWNAPVTLTVYQDDALYRLADKLLGK